MNSIEIITKFVDAINTKNLSEIDNLSHENFKLIDAHKNEISGKTIIIASWKKYFELFPNYHISISEILENSTINVILGEASAGYFSHKFNKIINNWNIPIAIKAIVYNKQIIEWQIFADTKIPFESIVE